MPSKKVRELAAGTKIRENRPSASRTASLDSFKPKDEEVQRLQRDTRESLDRLLENTPFGRGTLLTVEFDNTVTLTKTIAHNLGVPAKGFIICDQIDTNKTDTSVYRAEIDSGVHTTKGSQAETHIRLRASTSCKLKIWVWG